MRKAARLRVGFAGGGNMAEALIKGFKRGNIRDILVYDRSAERMSFLKKEYGVVAAKSNVDVVRGSDVVLLAVKPGDIGAVCAEIKDELAADKCVISIAAGVTVPFLESNLGTDRVVRVMPNTPAFVGKGMTVIASSQRTRKKDIAVAERLFSYVGDVLVMDEKFINAVTAVSGSGPAFVSLFVESLADGAVRMGIPREHALRLAVRTAEGALSMIAGGVHTVRMREMVTSPGGTTAEGLYVMEREGLKGIIMEALRKTCEKASSLAT